MHMLWHTPNNCMTLAPKPRQTKLITTSTSPPAMPLCYLQLSS